MNFDFSDEQKQMRDEARKFLAEKCLPKAVRVVLDGKEPYDRELWKGLAEMGFLGVAIPEEFGGAGAGHLELCVIAEEMGRALAPVPFSSTVYLAAEAILLAGSDAQKQKWLPLIASGGVNQKNAADFILAGAAALGIGQHLIPQNAIKRRQREWIHELARRYINMVSNARTQQTT